MEEHPIEGLMITAMNSIQEMVDVNTIVGEPIEANENVMIIPVSKVCFGFAAGGSEFKGETISEYSKKEAEEMIQYKFPFGGGSGAGVNINPEAFLVIQDDMVKLLPINHNSSIDKLLDYVPDLFEKINEKKASINKIATKIKEKDEEKENLNMKKRPKKHIKKTSAKYEFEYDNVKPETHMDDEMEEYDEDLDENLDD